MKRLSLLILALLGYSVVSNAQYFEEALRYSQSNSNLGSTARMQAIGGAQVALGGDISSAVVNPAGLGFFNKSVFVFTPSIDFINTDTEYGLFFNSGFEGQGTEEAFKSNFNLANIGTVIHFGKGQFTDDKFKGGSLAISLSRSNTFHLNRSYSGANDFNSLGDALAIDAGETDPDFFIDDFDSFGNVFSFDQAAYLSYLITPDYNGDDLVGYFADYDGFPVQREVIEERGSHYQLNLAWGGNYDDRFYFGGGLGAQIINSRINRSYQESDFGTFDASDNFIPDPRLNAVFLDDEVEVRGAGINFNAGIVFRPVPFMTIGASYISPSFISIDEESEFIFDVDWKPGALFVEDTVTIDLDAQEGPYDSFLFLPEYRLRTPARFNLGTALFIGKSGFLSADLEFVDYSNMNLNSDDPAISGNNTDIETLFESVMNVRIGGEYRFNKFMLRAGYAFFPDPYVNSSLEDRTNISFGFGYRTFDYFIDFAIVNSRFQSQAIPYAIDVSQSLDDLIQAQPVANSDISNTTVSLTFGLNF